MLRQTLFLIAALGLTPLGIAETIKSEKATFELEPVADGLDRPWSLLELPDGRLLVTERPGRLRVIDADGKLQKKPVAGIPEVRPKGQGGLLDIELHPDYANNGWLYISYSDPDDDGGALTKIVRGRLRGNEFVDKEVIFEAPADQYTGGPNHFGCRLEFDKDGYLFFSIGDRGRMQNAQDLSNVKGKVHRIHDDGKIPGDNPFVNEPNAMPTIWTYGNRNQQGLSMHPVTGEIWETEHGPKGGDELNLIKKGINYGWPVITYGINYNGTPITDKTSAPGMEQPVIHWTPSIAVCGIDFYKGEQFPEWQNDLLVTSLAHQKFIRLEIDDDKVTEQEIVFEKKGRIRAVEVTDDGEVYVVFDQPGKVVRLKPE